MSINSIDLIEFIALTRGGAFASTLSAKHQRSPRRKS
jgi:hypothetical protein